MNSNSHAGALLPCPFCGGAARSLLVSTPVPGMEDCNYWCVECTKCDSGRFCGVHGDSQEEAEEAWNVRAPQSGPYRSALEEVGTEFHNRITRGEVPAPSTSFDLWARDNWAFIAAALRTNGPVYSCEVCKATCIEQPAATEGRQG